MISMNWVLKELLEETSTKRMASKMAQDFLASRVLQRLSA